MDSKNTFAMGVVIALLVGGSIGYSMPEKNSGATASCMDRCMQGDMMKGGMMGMMEENQMNHDDMGHGAGTSHDMSDSMTSMTMHLSGKAGAELERAFLDDMIVHHEGAVAMAKMLLEGTTRPELVAMAKDIIAVQTREIETMGAWKAAWF